jgi:CBS domain-containing protein
MAIISISRGSLSGGEALALELHRRLGYPVISREVIVEAAREYGVSESKLAEGLDRLPSVWQRLTEHREGYLIAVQASLLSMVESGRAIYHGHAGHFLMKGLPGLIKLRLIAPLAARLQAAMTRRALSRDQAEAYIAEVDRQRERWVRHMYGEDCNNPHLYDFVVNLEYVSVESAAEMIAALAEQPAFTPTPESQQRLSDLAATARVRAALILKAKVPKGAVSAEMRAGVLHLWGSGYLQSQRDRVVSAVRSVAGVGEVVVGEATIASPVPGAPGGVTAHDIMLPLESYPRVLPSTTIREALVALGTSSVQLRDGHLIPPRYLLVVDDQGELQGLLTRRDLLRGLSPQVAMFEATRQEMARLVPFAAATTEMSFSWVSFFSSSAVQKSKEPVRVVMTPVRGTVDSSADLSRVVSTMLLQHVDLVPVLDGKRVEGVVLMSDVFHRVAEYVLEHGGTGA